MSAVLTGSFSGSLTGSGATVTVSTPLLNLTQAWSGTGTFTLDFANVTADSGPSTTSSLLIDRQYLGASKFSVTRSGALNASGNVVSGGSLVAGANVQMPASQFLFWVTRSLVGSPVDGVLIWTKNGGGQPTVANIGSASTAGAGARAWVTDATQTFVAASFGTTVTGGGANGVPVVSDGTNWKIG